jgi:ESF2/ABP1 family protein
MATRKRNEFLDVDGSEDEDVGRGYDSEAEEVKGRALSSKRRKLESDASDESEDDEDNVEHKTEEVITKGEDTAAQDKKGTQADAKESKAKGPKPAELPGLDKPLTKKNLVATAAAIKRSGVVYLSRIPPFMKPQKLRSLLEPYGTINRIFLTPEDPASHTRRVRNGGNKKRSFTDGWVEFVNKADAKKVCELLNARPIGGKKGTYYYDDVWNLLYLKGFKWNNLTEQIAAENAERTNRLRAEISKTTKENRHFVENVEKAKKLEGMEAKRAAKRQKDAEMGGGEGATAEIPATSSSRGHRPMTFKQKALAPKKKDVKEPEDVKRVLSKIF